jgi:hypothetical protein
MGQVETETKEILEWVHSFRPMPGQNMDNWLSLKLELQKQAEFSGGNVQVTFTTDPNSDAFLISRNKEMKLKYWPERNVVRWETEEEYGFDRLSERTAPLAATLIKRFAKE